MFAVGGSPSADAGNTSPANGEPRTPDEPNFTRLYVIVIAELVVTIIVLTVFTRTFA